MSAFVGGPLEGEFTEERSARVIHVSMYSNDPHFSHPTNRQDARAVMGVYKWLRDDDVYAWSGEWE